VAVALASALVTAVSSGMRTGQVNLEVRLERLMGSVDARLVQQTGAPFDDAILQEVRSWPGVRTVQGRLSGSLTLIRADAGTDGQGRIRRTTAQARGVDASDDPRLKGPPLREGRPRADRLEIVLDPLSATALAVGVGDRVRVTRLGEPVELTVCGISDRPMLGALQRAFVEVDRSLLAELSDRPSLLTQASIVLAPGNDVAAWCRDQASRVPEGLLLEPAEMATSGMDRQVGAARLGFLLACSIAVLAGAFIVGVGMTTSVGELGRELALLRCLGASRGQLFAGPLLAGATLSLAAALAGVPVGLAGATAVAWWFRDSLPVGLVPSGEGILLALTASLASGVLGSALPAWQAASTQPLAALRSRSRPPARHGPWVCLLVGAALAAVEAVIVTHVQDPQRKFWMHALLGLACAHTGWFLLCVPLLRMVATAVATPTSRLLRLPPGLLRGSVARAPYRLGLTAGALMMGLSVLVTTWSHGEGMLGEIRSRIRFGDAFAMKVSGLSAAEQAALRGLPGVRQAAAVGYLPLRVGGDAGLGIQTVAPPSVICVGFEPDAFLAMNRLEWIQGTPESALPRLRDGRGALVAEQFLTARGLQVGDRIELVAPRSRASFEIVGVVRSAGLDIATQVFGIRSVYMEHAMSCVFLDLATVGRHFGAREAVLMQMELVPDPLLTDDAMSDRVAAAAPGAIFASGRAIRAAIDDVGRLVLGVSGTVAFAALLVASLGVGSVISAQVQGRRGELGVLRAVGAARTPVVSLILAEAGVVAMTAVIAGTGLGWELAWAGRVLFADLAGLRLAAIFPLWAWLAGCGVVMLLSWAAAWPTVRGLLRQSPRELLSQPA
jgi:putative ABC transport system permease protein